MTGPADGICSLAGLGDTAVLLYLHATLRRLQILVAAVQTQVLLIIPDRGPTVLFPTERGQDG